MSNDSICYTYHQLKDSSPNGSKTTQDESHTKESAFRKVEVMGKRSQENRPKVEKIRQKEQQAQAEEQKRIYRKVGSN